MKVWKKGSWKTCTRPDRSRGAERNRKEKERCTKHPQHRRERKNVHQRNASQPLKRGIVKTRGSDDVANGKGNGKGRAIMSMKTQAEKTYQLVNVNFERSERVSELVYRNT